MSGMLVPSDWPVSLPSFSSNATRNVRLEPGIDIFQVPTGLSAARAGAAAKRVRPARSAGRMRDMSSGPFAVWAAGRISDRKSSQPFAVSIYPLDGASNGGEFVVVTQQDRMMQHDCAVMRAFRLREFAAGAEAPGGPAHVGGTETRIDGDSLGANRGAESLAIEGEGVGVELVADFVERGRAFALVGEALQSRNVGEKFIESRNGGGAASMSLIEAGELRLQGHGLKFRERRPLLHAASQRDAQPMMQVIAIGNSAPPRPALNNFDPPKLSTPMSLHVPARCPCTIAPIA